MAKDDKAIESEDAAIAMSGLPNLEAQLLVKLAGVITTVEKQFSDDPEFACCSCERLHHQSSVTSVKHSKKKFNSSMWQRVKGYVVEHIEQYKLLNVKEDAMDNRQKRLDIMCFPTLLPSG